MAGDDSQGLHNLKPCNVCTIFFHSLHENNGRPVQQYSDRQTVYYSTSTMSLLKLPIIKSNR